MAGRTTTTKPFGRQQRLVLYLGVLLAVVAAAVTLYAINSSGGGGGGDGRRAVVVAAQDIPANTRVTPEMLQVQLLPPDQINAEAFTARSQVLDRVFTQEVKAGQQIVPGTVSDKVGEGVAFKVEPGHRALAIVVKEVVTSGGNARPGDHVDVVGVFQVKTLAGVQSILAAFAPNYVGLVDALPKTCQNEVTEGGNQGTNQNTAVGCVYNLTLTLEQDVRLLGLAQKLTSDETKDQGTVETPTSSDTQPKAATATLDVTPQQAQHLALADQYGALRLAVRPFGDKQINDIAPIVTVIDEQQDVR